MAKQIALKNKETGTVYPILRWNKETNKILLKGPNSQFEVDFDKDNLQQMGYTLVQLAETPATDDEE